MLRSSERAACASRKLWKHCYFSSQPVQPDPRTTLPGNTIAIDAHILDGRCVAQSVVNDATTKDYVEVLRLRNVGACTEEADKKKNMKSTCDCPFHELKSSCVNILDLDGSASRSARSLTFPTRSARCFRNSATSSRNRVRRNKDDIDLNKIACISSRRMVAKKLIVKITIAAMPHGNPYALPT